jgi:uncharacterized protein (DUF2236 family)
MAHPNVERVLGPYDPRWQAVQSYWMAFKTASHTASPVARYSRAITALQIARSVAKTPSPLAAAASNVGARRRFR